MFVVGHKDGVIEKVSNIHLSKVKGYDAYTVIGGEFAVAREEDKVAFKTLLGSCVAMIMYDKKSKVMGMNHFLLPSSTMGGGDMKYGLFSIESMLNEMYRLGATKKNLVAKIAGGANVLKNLSSVIGQRNVDFALDFCKKESIPIEGQDILGENGRVILLIDNFKTFIRGVKNSSIESQIVDEEKSLEKELNQHPELPESGGIDLF